jgi:DNA-binding YbaB/EbfC family protein
MLRCGEAITNSKFEVMTMKGGMGNLMKQAQKMQADMARVQEELANAEVTGKAGGGMVSVVMTGRHDLKRVNIDDSLMGDDKEMLEDLIAAAVNDAVRQLEQASSEKMGSVTAGLNLPGGMKLPF